MKQKTTIIYFSPWLFSGQENLTFAFFHELEKQLNGKKWEATKGYLKKIVSFTLLTAGSVINTYIPGAKAAAKTLKELIDQTPSLEKTKKGLQDVLKEQKNPLLIIIDDIDRLPADEMRQIFRMVKSVADLPYVTYLLAFDRKIVERALEKGTDPEGPEWIEKIVQGSFDLPQILPFRLKSYFWKELNNKLPDLYDKFQRDPVIEDFFNPFFENLIYPSFITPRQVNRLMNSLIVQWMTVNTIVNPCDLVFIETCRLFQKKLYDYIKRNKIKLCKPEFSDFKEIKETVPNINIDSFKDCFFKHSTNELMNLYLDNQVINRLFSDKAFYNYFLYDQNPTCYPIEEFQIIDNYLAENSREAIITIINQDLDEKLENGDLKNLSLIQEWGEFAYHDNNNLKNILMILAETYDILYHQKPTNIIRNTFIKIFNQISSDEDTNDILITIYQKHSLSRLLIYFMINCEAVQLVGSTNTNIISTYLFKNTDLCNNIKKIYEKQITKLEKDKGLKAISSNLILLITASTEKVFGQYSGNWIKEKIKNNPTNALCIMENLIITSKVISNQTKEEKECNEIDEKIKKNIDLSSLINIAKNILTTNDEHNKQIAQKFLKAYNNKPTSFMSE